MPRNLPRINTTTIKCIQWNARGLTKSKLEEFRRMLSSVKPEIVLLHTLHAHTGTVPSMFSFAPSAPSRKIAQTELA
jgi:hypothetical protein